MHEPVTAAAEAYYGYWSKVAVVAGAWGVAVLVLLAAIAAGIWRR